MTNKILSIEIENTRTKVCEIDNKAKKYKVFHCFHFETPKDMLEDGYVKVSEQFANELTRKCKENHIKTRKVVFTITSSKIATREVFIPFVKMKRIIDVVEANATEYFPVDISDYHLTYKILEVVTGETPSDSKYKLLVIAVPNDLISSYYELAKNCALNIKAIDYNGNSILQAVKNQFTKDTSLIIKIDEKSTLLTIIKNKTIALQRTINYGADNIIEIMMDSKGYGENLSFEEALDILRSKSCIQDQYDNESYDIKFDEADSSDNELMLQSRVQITASLGHLVHSINRVIDYYNSRNTGNAITNMELTGLAGDFKGVSSFLSYEIGNDVTELNSLEDINFDKFKKQKFSLGDYVACFGAVIEPVDFISGKLHEKKKKKVKSKEETNSHIAFLIFIGGILISFTLAFVSIYGYKLALDTKKSTEVKAENYKQVESTYNEYKDIKQSYDKVTGLIQSIQSPNENLINFIDELEVKMPSNIHIISLTANNEMITMSIQVDSKVDAAEVIKQLRTINSISQVEVSDITENIDETSKTTVNFTVNCYYKVNDSSSKK